MEEIISRPLIISQIMKQTSLIALNFEYNPKLISPINAWTKSIDDMNNIANKLKLFPGYCFTVNSVNSCKTGYTSNILIHDNKENPMVEIETFFTRKYLLDKGVSSIKKATEIFQIINKQIEEYKHQCKESTVYDILRYYFPSTEEPSQYGYPQLNFVISLSDEVFPAFDSIHQYIENMELPQYINKIKINECDKDLKLEARKSKDPKYMVSVIKDYYNPTLTKI